MSAELGLLPSTIERACTLTMSPSDYIIRICLIRDEVSLQELNPPVWRRFKVSSAVNLELLHDKLIAPIMVSFFVYNRALLLHAPTYQQMTQSHDMVYLFAIQLL